MSVESRSESLQISVVIGTKNANRSIEACLKSLLAQTETVKAEIIVADASTDGTAELVAAEFPTITLFQNKPDLLVPQLWKQGLDAAQAPVVAFTIGQCVPVSDWLVQALKALDKTAVAVGGPLHGPEHGGNIDWALYFSRYSRFLPGSPARSIDDIAGDNAAYKVAALQQCRPEWQTGFWENMVNARLVANGQTLLWAPEMAVTFRAAEKLSDIVRTRFRHGRNYGSTRLGNTLPKRVVRFFASPLLVPVLLSRIYRRVKEQQPDWLPRFWRSLPGLMVILLAWSTGEASGYLWPERPKT